MKSFPLFAASILFAFVVTLIVTSPGSRETTPPVKNADGPAFAGPGGRWEAGYAYQALEWQYRMRSRPSGNIPPDWREKALSQMSAMKNRASDPSLSAVSWAALGPDNVGGRIRSIAIDPSNSSIVYCGSVSGGIWKSTNAGATWAPTDDMAANLVIGALAIDPNNPAVIYAGTGEGYFNIDALRGAGMLKSTDGGGSWALLTGFSPSPSGYPYYINDIYIRPDNSSIVFAATNSGLYQSTNAGAAWTYIPKNTGTRRATQIVADPVSPGVFYVAYGNFTTDGIYKTTNGGTSFNKLAGGFPTTGFTRIAMAISRSNPSTLYAALTDASSYGTHSIQKSTDGGASWAPAETPMDLALGGTHMGNQGWYNNVIVVHPTDPDRVYAGGINSFRSTTGGSTWAQMTNGYAPSAYPFMHVDQHAIAFDPGNPAIMYFGNDGGMYKSTNGGTNFTEINNGLAVTQFYSGAVHPTLETYYGGTQDNGTIRTVSAPAWTELFSGDGGAMAVDYLNPATIYGEYVFLNFLKSTTSGNTWFRAMTGIPVTGGSTSDGTSDRCAFIAPFVMDPTNPQVLVAGTWRVFRTTNGGGNWTDITIGFDLPGEGSGLNGVGGPGSVISALAIAKAAPATIYAGTTGSDTSSRVWVTTNTGTTWSNTTKSPLPDRAVSSIAVDPTNALRAYAGFSGYSANTPATPGHIFRTTNRGSTWSNISGDLPDVPVNAVAVDTANAATHIFVGTDLGMFETTNGGTTWTEQNTGLAKVAVFDLDLRGGDGVLVAATHGRGMYRSAASVITSVTEVPSGIPSAHRLEQNYPNPFNPSTTIAFDLASASDVKLIVYDAAGRVVARLFDGTLEAGSYRSTFDAGEHASGVYFCVLESASRDGFAFRDMKKMLLVR